MVFGMRTNVRGRAPGELRVGEEKGTVGLHDGHVHHPARGLWGGGGPLGRGRVGRSLTPLAGGRIRMDEHKGGGGPLEAGVPQEIPWWLDSEHTLEDNFGRRCVARGDRDPLSRVHPPPRSADPQPRR